MSDRSLREDFGLGEQAEVLGPIPAGRDPEAYDRERRKVLWRLPTGLYVLGSCAGAERNLMTLSWAMQVATRPKLVAVSVEEQAVTRRLIDSGGVFAISVLEASDRVLVRRFVKPVEDVEVSEDGRGTMGGVGVGVRTTGAPVLDAAAAWVDCAVVQRVPLGSHVLFIGEVVDAGFRDGTEPAEVLRMDHTRMNYGG
jgi:flavin reductase (DIM6/NTAB) family NADH-FMN oxidoreductase RutF